ncbi:MAG: hypothetical protein AAGC56_03850 [Pseudomonadota bacterium]
MRFRTLAMLTCAATTTVAVAPARAAGWAFDLEVAAEIRAFPNDPQYPGQFEHFQPSGTLTPELSWESADRKHEIVIKPFARIDGQDDERTHADLREAFYRYVSDGDWSVLIGVNKVFWGVTESRHLVDIVNQTDAVEDIDEEDKLGEAMVQFTLQKDWGKFDFFVMPGFRERTFPGVDGRLRFELAVDDDNPVFERDGGRGAVDLAGRYSHYFGSWDVGLSIFHGTSREPRFAIPQTNDRILPVYDRITQIGADIQYTKDAWLWKGEAIVREGQGDTFFAAVAGFEYTLYQIGGRSWDLGLLAEYLYDGRDDGFAPEVIDPINGPEQTALVTETPVTIFNNDVFVGARLALNDTQDTSMLAGTAIDAEDGTMSAFIEAERRIGTSWKAELEARLFLNVDQGNFVDAFRDDDVVTARLTRYF